MEDGTLRASHRGELSENCGSRLSLVFGHASEKVLGTVSFKGFIGKHLDTATGLEVSF